MFELCLISVFVANQRRWPVRTCHHHYHHFWFDSGWNVCDFLVQLRTENRARPQNNTGKVAKVMLSHLTNLTNFPSGQHPTIPRKQTRRNRSTVVEKIPRKSPKSAQHQIATANHCLRQGLAHHHTAP
jgi:hypothetical protein